MELGQMGQSGAANWGAYGAILLLLIEAAKRIATLTPGKRDDEIVSRIERLVRGAIDFVAGQHTDRSDPGMIKSKEE